jgi:Transglycosylase SLT domain
LPNPRPWLAAGVEMAAVLTVALVADLALLGRVAQWFHGGGLWSHLVPFTVAVVAVGTATVGGLWAWLRVRRRLVGHWPRLPTVAVSVLALAALTLTMHPAYQYEVSGLRRLTDGPAQARRAALAHQVFAAYRRTDLAAMQRLLERGRVFEPTVQEAAAAFDLDAEVLMGIAAAESSFHPRDSTDGGRGLFQVTAPPRAAVAAAERLLGTTPLDPVNQRHNAFVGAATFRTYLDQMNGDPFLGLLAYNIGPRNGGLRSIMDQYGARDFVTIQPYLKHLPRDYPIRVLTPALAYRIWRREGRLLPYEADGNAVRIQRIGIPGLLSADAGR